MNYSIMIPQAHNCILNVLYMH